MDADLSLVGYWLTGAIPSGVALFCGMGEGDGVIGNGGILK